VEGAYASSIVLLKWTTHIQDIRPLYSIMQILRQDVDFCAMCVVAPGRLCASLTVSLLKKQPALGTLGRTWIPRARGHLPWKSGVQLVVYIPDIRCCFRDREKILDGWYQYRYGLANNWDTWLECERRKKNFAAGWGPALNSLFCWKIWKFPFPLELLPVPADICYLILGNPTKTFSQASTIFVVGSWSQIRFLVLCCFL
jgi:hypothetical protein